MRVTAALTFNAAARALMPSTPILAPERSVGICFLSSHCTTNTLTLHDDVGQRRVVRQCVGQRLGAAIANLVACEAKTCTQTADSSFGRTTTHVPAKSIFVVERLILNAWHNASPPLPPILQSWNQKKKIEKNKKTTLTV
jgi:hypothetical protein